MCDAADTVCGVTQLRMQLQLAIKATREKGTTREEEEEDKEEENEKGEKDKEERKNEDEIGTETNTFPAQM